MNDEIGIAGPKTRADEALREFQRSRGLTIDGIYGPQTPRGASQRVALKSRKIIFVKFRHENTGHFC